MKKFKVVVSLILAVLIFGGVFSASNPIIAENIQNRDVANLTVEEISIDSESNTINFLSEAEGKREQYVKHFKMSDGTYKAAQYDVPVHFLDSDGNWVDYDNSLTETDCETERSIFAKDFVNSQSDVEIRLSKKTNGSKLVRMKTEDYSVSWNFDGIKKVTGEVTEQIADDGDPTTLEKLSSEVIYENVFKNIDLQYILTSGFLKENIILKDKDVASEFYVNYKNPDLTPKLYDEKTVVLCDEKDNAVFVINAPYMEDAEGHTSDGITLSIAESKNGKFTLKITLDEEWLNSEGVVYPVTVDPIMTASRVLFSENGCYSAYVSSQMPTDSFGKRNESQQGTHYEGSLYVGYESGRGAVRSYFKCENLPSLSVGDKIVDASLSMYLVDSNTLTVNVYKVLSNWEPHTVTWNNQPSVDDYLISDYHSFKGESHSWITWEITDLARLWYSGELANNGIMFKADYEGSSHRRARFYSTGYTTYSEARPLLVISYRNMSGYEDYYSYTNLSSGNGGVASVNNYNGNFVYSQYLTEDCGGEIMPVNVSLVYNSNKADENYANLGNGVQTNYHLFIKPNPNINNNSIDEEKKYKYYLNDADGTEHYFYFEDLNGITGKDEDGLGYELWVNPQSNTPADENERFHWVKYKITDKDKNTMEFNRYGLLIRIKSSTGKEITIQHEDSVNSDTPRIKYIYDGVGRQYIFNYTGDNRISEITDPAGRVTKLSYVNAFLYEILFSDGERVSYGHNGGQWTYIQSESGDTEITFDGSSQKRVSLIKTVFDGTIAESYGFSYLQNETVVTDLANRKYTYQFNDYGQTTGIVSNNSGQAQFFSFAPGNSTSANANKLNTSSKIQTSTVNYLKNPSFSAGLNDDYWEHNTAPEGTYSVTADWNLGHFSNGCVKISKSSLSGLTSVVQTVGQVPSGVYTLSAYSTTASGTFNGTGFLILEIWNGDVRETGYVADVYQSNNWDKYTLTAEVGEGKTLRVLAGIGENSTGEMWFDDIQLESGYGATSFNLLENAGFKNQGNNWELLNSSYNFSENIADWSVTSLGAGEVAGQTNAIYTRATSASASNFLSQRVNVSGNKGDVFSLGGWAYAASAPLNNGTKPENEQPQFDILFQFYDSDNQLVGSEKKEFNPDVDDWQFVSFMAIAPKDYAYCLYFVEYNRNVNNLYFTGGYCYKETYGQTYTYDDNGNIVSTQDLAKTESSFAYSNNQMTKLLNPSGSRYMYSYDDQNKLVYALSSDGQQYGFQYDSNSNVTDTYITPLKPASVIEAGKAYYIVNAGTGKAIDSGTATSGADEVTCQSYLAYLNSQKWFVASTEESNVFQMASIQRTPETPSCTNANNYFFKVSGESNENGSVVMTNNSYYSTDNQYFKPVKNDDGTFTLYMKKSGYEAGVNGEYKCLNCAETEAVGSTPKNTVYETVCDKNNLKETMKWYFYEVPGDNEKYLSTHASYTSNGNFTTGINDVNGNNVLYSYNETSGQLISTTDGHNNRTQYEYAPNSNRITSVTAFDNQNGQVAKSSYVYDDSNRLSEIQSSTGQSYNFTYDSFGRVTSIKIGNQELISTTYDQFSRPTVKSYGNGEYITTVYDNLDRVVEIRYNEDYSKRITYGYANNGNLAIVTDYFSLRKTVYTYDLSGRVVDVKTYSTTDLNNYSTLCDWFKYRYEDKTNYLVNVTHWTPETGTQEYEYVYGDVNQGQMPDQIYSVKFNGQEIQSYTFDSLGRLQKKTTPTTSGNAFEHIYDYKNFENSNRTTTQVSEFYNFLGKYTYTYDYVGNISSVVFTSYDELVNPSKTTYYTYDALGQLIDVVDGDDHYAYGYDNVGNIVANKYDKTYFGSYFEKTYSYSDNEWKDQLSSFNGQAIHYDALGNPVYYKGATLTWSEGRRLTSFDNGAYSLTFAYDSSGKRIKKTVNGMEYKYIYSGDTVIAITNVNGTNVLKFICDENGDYIGFTYGSGTYYYIRNLQNDVVAIADANKNVLAIYSYDPWGNCTVSGKFANTIGDINPIRYRGYFYDEETGLYYLQSRYYDPETCRFISADEASVVTVSPDSANYDKNLYAYCDNNPVMRADEGGAFWCFVLGATVISGLISGLTTAISNIIKKEPIDKGVGMAILSGAASGFVSSVAGPVLSVVGNAAISMAENVVKQYKKNEGFSNFNVEDMLIEGAIGGVSSAIGGKIDIGIEKQAANLGKQAINRTVNTLKHKGIKPALAEVAKAFSYYNKSTISYYTSVGRNMFRESISSLFSKIVR